MEVDGKVIAAALGSLVLGGGGGFLTSEVKLANVEARVSKIEQVEAGFASKEGLSALNEQMKIYIEAMRVIHDDIDSRLDRHGERLNAIEAAQ